MCFTHGNKLGVKHQVIWEQNITNITETHLCAVHVEITHKLS